MAAAGYMVAKVRKVKSMGDTCTGEERKKL
jgi:hypothetical protein